MFLHGPGSGAACLLRNLTRTKAYKNDFQLLPRQLAEKVATLHLILLGAIPTVLAQEHAGYMVVKVEGPFKGDRHSLHHGLPDFPGFPECRGDPAQKNPS